MSKPYTETNLSDQISADMTWRLREISDLKSAILSSDGPTQKVLLRALIAICYAHWEGFVRLSARKYMEHIAMRKFQYAELNRQFYKNYFMPRLSALSNSSTSISQKCDLIDELLDSQGGRFSRPNDDLINTRSNLNHSVLSDICIICGLGVGAVGADETFIDVILLKRRNSIAHGEDTFIGLSELDDVCDQTISHMRFFKDAIENQVYLKTYKAA